MKYFYMLIISVCLCFLLNACATLQTYAPTAVHVPLMEHKGQVKGFVSAGDMGSTDAGVCFAFTENMAIMSNIHWNRQKGENHTGYNVDNIYGMMEVAPGYYMMQEDSSFWLEVYVGVGLGYTERDYRYKGYSNFIPLISEGFFNRNFIQANIGTVYHMVELSFALRAANVIFYNMKVSGYAEINNGDPATFTKFSTWYLEPILNFNVGIKNIKLNFQAGISSPVSGNEKYEYLRSENVFLRAGLQFKFNLLKKK